MKNEDTFSNINYYPFKLMKNCNKLFFNLILIILISFTLTSCTGQSLPPIVIEEIYLGVPVVKQPADKLWCLPASTKSALNYYGMEITQEEIADYVINPETGLGSPSRLEENSDKLGIKVHCNSLTLEKIKNEIKKGNPVIVLLDYSLENKGNHFYVIDGFNEEEMRLMCPLRGFVYWSYDYIKQLNDNFWVDASGYEPNLYYTTLVWPIASSSF